MYIRTYICVHPCHYRVDTLLSIKIADFGLAKDIYSTEYYRIDKHTRLPAKWMSLESLLDGYFDEKTDVVRMRMYRVYLYIVQLVMNLLFYIVICALRPNNLKQLSDFIVSYSVC